MPAPYFTQLNGIAYINWQPSASESFLLPANGFGVNSIAVGGSPFSYTALTNQQVLIGGGQITSVSIFGTYPPSAPAGFVVPPSGNFLISYQTNNDSTYPLQANQTIVVTYTVAPQMYSVAGGGQPVFVPPPMPPPGSGFIFGQSGFGTGGF